MSEIFNDLGVEISFASEDNFLMIKETLTRIGIASKKENKLFQSCHILHKQGKYAILHFKEMFILDGKVSTLSEEDIKRRNRIVKLLEEWGLIKVLEPNKITEEKLAPLNHVKVIKSKEKANWDLQPKYLIGNVKIKT